MTVNMVSSFCSVTCYADVMLISEFSSLAISAVKFPYAGILGRGPLDKSMQDPGCIEECMGGLRTHLVIMKLAEQSG